MSGARKQTGLTLVEVLVTIVLLGILLVPAIDAVQTAIVGNAVHNEVATSHYRLQSRIEELLAEPFSNLEASATAAGGPGNPSSYSESAGLPGRLLVYLSAFDGDNADADSDPFTGTDDGLIWIRVAIDGSVYELQTVAARGH